MTTRETLTTEVVATGFGPASRPRSTGTDEPGSFRHRLLDGLAASIREKGFRDSTVADIVRNARTSRRTFYAEFNSREECYIALLTTVNELMKLQIAAAVDPAAPRETQIQRAIEAYVEAVVSEPEITLSWIRELPGLGAIAHEVQRSTLETIIELLLQLADNDQFRRDGAGPVSREMATLLLGGIRELTATIVEDGGDIRGVTGVAVRAATLLLGPASVGKP
ncbi:TetR family transcriptional regulator [Jatrophihabitans sp. GAS493]|nr:TetR/AcrR family transcriptional regulator [Jatrophihabitans sp. GAS493]SOD71017.1 TetR family transcriptional regulator [Jatrophihabitans sp. GAS493]